MTYDHDHATRSYFGQYKADRRNVSLRMGTRTYIKTLYREALKVSLGKRIHWQRAWLLAAAAHRQMGNYASARDCIQYAHNAA